MADEFIKERILCEYRHFFDDDNLRHNLAKCALYLTIFELLNSCIIHQIRQFFLGDEELDIKDDLPIQYQIEMKELLHKYKGRRAAKEYLACCHWLYDIGAITQQDQKDLEDIKIERNKIAHELPHFLIDPNRHVNLAQLSRAKELIDKIDTWWIVNVNYVGSSPPIESEVRSSRSIIIDHIFASVPFHDDMNTR